MTRVSPIPFCAAPAQTGAADSCVDRLDPLAGTEWDQAIASFPQAGPFHTAAWARTLHATYGFTPCYLRIPQGLDKPILLPLMEVRSSITGTRGISLPFTDACPALVSEPQTSNLKPQNVSSKFETRNSQLATRTALSKLATRNTQLATRTALSPLSSPLTSLLSFCHSQNWRYLELRGGENLVGQVPPSSQYYTHRLDLTAGEAALWENCHSSVHRAVRKAQKAGVNIRKRSDAESVERFYHLQCRTRRKHGLHPQPRSFFRQLHQHMVQPGSASLYLAELGQNIIAGAVFLHAGRKVVFKFGASDETQLDVRANNYLMWKAIADFAIAGFSELDLGRTDCHQDGLRRYKSSFGAVEELLYYYRFDYSMNSFVAEKPGRLLPMLQPFFRRAPLALNRLCGALLYRHIA